MKSEVVDDEWLVIFNQYYERQERLDIMESALGTVQFTVVDRNNPAQLFKSDFDVIKTEDKTAVTQLHTSESVKFVRQQKQFFRTLKYSPSENPTECNPCPKNELPSEQRVRRSRKIHSISSGDYWFGSERFKSRKLMRSVVKPVTAELQADVLWEAGFTGQGVKVAVFDTGLPPNHPHFRNVKDRTNWTNEKTLDDGLGHGTFVAGVIASQGTVRTRHF